MNPFYNATATCRYRRPPRRSIAIVSVVIGTAISLLDFPAAAEDASKPSAAAAASGAPYKFTNRLIDSNDPYLLLHAHNPVDWYPWGPEAFAKAEKENKPIFLSIGYSTCYWCHVAERTIYSNPEIATLMNQRFINVKVDSEQRPDVDRIYMLARQLMTGGGGWPNNLFLTPDLKPFYAGSYFPPRDDPRAGPGFPTVLAEIDRVWRNDRAQALSVAENVMATMRRVQLAMTGSAVAPIKPDAWLAKARDTLLPRFDPQYGGFADRRGGPKFPNPPRLALLLLDYQTNHISAALSAVLNTLDAMTFGGIHDQLAGGFHRYSTEPTWSVPHFEKMLYDNAQLLRLYAEAFRITGLPLYRQIALETARYLGRDMMAPDGGFYTARDAQLHGVEGEGYLWTRGEIISLLGEKEATRFLSVYSLTPVPRPEVPDVVHPRDVNGEPPAVLRLRAPADLTLKTAGFKDVPQMLAEFASDREKLLAAREKRAQPARDEKIVISLNGLAIAALAESGQILDDPQLVGWAQKAAERIWALAYDQSTGVLKHEIYRAQVQTSGFLQDYASLGAAFMSLADATGASIWRDRATLLANSILDRFARADGFFSTTANEKDVLIPIADDGDMETPSGTSSAIDLLLRLHEASGEVRYLDATARAVTRLSGQFQDHPESWAAAVATLNRRKLPSARESATAANSPSGPSATGGIRVPVTADHVRVTASAMSVPDGEQVLVTIKVDDKFHINANPASFDFLIPTSVEFKGIKPAKVEYPKPIRFTAEFAPEGFDVYEGSIAVIAKFPKGSLRGIKSIQGAVTAQACTNQICLPPSTLPISTAVGDR
jgi:uncharacterized protein YyaL (SSP411 family)